MSEHRIDIEDDAGVRLITFDRPEVRNAFDAAMYRAVTDALVGALGDDRVRAVVLTGRGKAFTAGQDLREMAALAAGRGRRATGIGFPALLDAVVSFDKPLLAAVHGVGVGLGCTLLGHVDLVLIDEGARLRVPFAELGVPPEAASSWLCRPRMGWQRAAAMLLASEWIDAGQAVESGLALRVCPSGTVLEETLTLARRIASFAPARHPGDQAADDGRRPGRTSGRPRPRGGGLCRPVRRPDHNPGAALTAGLDR